MPPTGPIVMVMQALILGLCVLKLFSNLLKHRVQASPPPTGDPGQGSSPWLMPLLGPLLVLGILCTVAPRLLQYFQNQIQQLTHTRCDQLFTVVQRETVHRQLATADPNQTPVIQSG